MVETLITFAAGVFIGSSLGVFLMALAVAAKRADEELEELGSQEDTLVTYSCGPYMPLCEDCKHHIRSERRCDYGGRCGFERRDDEIDGSVPY